METTRKTLCETIAELREAIQPFGFSVANVDRQPDFSQSGTDNIETVRVEIVRIRGITGRETTCEACGDLERYRQIGAVICPNAG